LTLNVSTVTLTHSNNKQQKKGRQMDTELNALQQINAGITLNTLEIALKEVAIGVTNSGNKGTVTLTIVISPQKNAEGQVNIDATVNFKKPNLKGFKQEQRTDSTPMFVSRDGLSAMPEQPHLDFDKSNNVTELKTK
jgi:hypothetical protein